MVTWWGALGADRLTDSSASIVASIIATMPLELRPLADVTLKELAALPAAGDGEPYKFKADKAAANKRAGSPAADTTNWGTLDYASLVSKVPLEIIRSQLVQSGAAEFASASNGDGGAVLTGRVVPTANQMESIKRWGFLPQSEPQRTAVFIEQNAQAVAAVATVVANGVVAMHFTGNLKIVQIGRRPGGNGGGGSSSGGQPPKMATAIFIAEDQPTVLQLDGLYYDVSSLATPGVAGVNWTLATGHANTPDELDVGTRAPFGCPVLATFTADDSYSAVWHEPGFTLPGGPPATVTKALEGPACISWRGGSVWVNSRTGCWDERVTVAFLILFGAPIPASVLKGFPMSAAQRAQMASQHRVLASAPCPVTGGQVLFEVYADIEMQDRLGYTACLCRAIAHAVAPTITGAAISNVPVRSGTVRTKRRRSGSVRGKACKSKVTLTYYDASQNGVVCPTPGCWATLNFLDRPCTGSGAKGCSHAPNGDAQAGWRLTHGSLVHSADCVCMGPYATSQQMRLTEGTRAMIAAAGTAGVGAAVASRLVSNGDNAANAVTPTGARYEMCRQEKVAAIPPPPPETLIQPGPDDSPCHWLNATRGDKSVVAMVAIYDAVSGDESRGTVVELCLNGKSYNITSWYNGHVGGIPQWSVAEDEVFARLNNCPTPPPASLCEPVFTAVALAPEGSQLKLRVAVKCRSTNLHRFWRASEKLDIDGTGTVSNVPGMTAVAMTFPDAEQRTWPVIEGVVCGQTTANYIFIFDFCLPLICGKCLFGVNVLATDGEAAEIRPVLAAVGAAQAVATERAAHAGAMRQDEWGNCYRLDARGSVVGRIDPRSVTVKQSTSSLTELALGVIPGLGGGGLTHHRDTFHLLHKPATAAHHGLTSYYHCVLTTLELWMLHSAQTAESRSELQTELQLMKDWINDPNRSLLASETRRNSVESGTVDPASTGGGAVPFRSRQHQSLCHASQCVSTTPLQDTMVDQPWCG